MFKNKPALYFPVKVAHPPLSTNGHAESFVWELTFLMLKEAGFGVFR
jgi:hypothetical protein